MVPSGSALLSFIISHGPFVIFVVVLIEELGIPIPVPSDLLLLFSGSLVSHGQLNLVLTVATVVFAIVLGTTALYTVARRGGRPLLERYGSWIHLDESRISRAEQRLQVHGFWSLAALRLVPGLRPYSTMTAGILGLPRYQAVLAFAFSGLIWSLTWIGIGTLLGPRLWMILPAIQRVEHTVGLGAIAAVGIVALIFVTRSRLSARRSTSSHEQSR